MFSIEGNGMMNNPSKSKVRIVALALCLTATTAWIGLGMFQADTGEAGAVADSEHKATKMNGTGLAAPRSAQPEAGKASRAQLNEAYGKLPLSFEVNKGQFDSRVKFASRAGGHELYLTPTEAVLAWNTPAAGNKVSSSLPREVAERQGVTDRRLDRLTRYGPLESDAAYEAKLDSRQVVLRMKLIGSNRSASAEPIGELQAKSNYFIGNEPRKWRTGISNYSKVRFRSVYRGIDLVYYGDQRNLEYDFNVAPGANPEAIKFSFECSKRARIDNNGDLVLTTFDGEDVRHRKPVAYQGENGARRYVGARYVIDKRGKVSFSVSRYDRSKPLVVDPVLVYSTLLGGSDDEAAYGIAVDSAGNAYVTGETSSVDFPTVNALQPMYRPIFLTKLNAAGDALIYSTYLGGTIGEQAAFGIAVDSVGNAYLTGITSALNFPTVNALQPLNGGRDDAFVVKVNSTGSALIYSTYLGGSRDDFGSGIAADSSGNAFVTGMTISRDFPKVNALQPNHGGGAYDAFVTNINATGSAFIYSTYLGGGLDDFGASISVDAGSNAYVTGNTTSVDFPALNALQPSFSGKTLFKSTNRADNWSAINNGVPNNASVKTIAIDPNSTSTVYAGVSPGGIFKTTDAGNHWKAINTGIPETDVDFVTAIVVDPSNSLTVYAGCEGFSVGVYKSTDGGVSWNATGATFRPAFALVIDPHTPSTLYLGSFEGVYKTTDAGASWVKGNRPGGRFGAISCIAIDPANPTTLYAGTSESDEMYKTTDGVTWGFAGHPSDNAVNAIAIDPVTTSVVYAVAGGAYRSTNHGTNWTPINNGLEHTQTTPGALVDSIAVDPVTPSTLYAGTRLGVFKSTNSGASWDAMNAGLEVVEVMALAIDPQTPANLYAGAFNASDAFVAEINPAGSALVFSTYLGGGGLDAGSSIALDSSANIFVTGGTTSTGFSIASPLRPFSGDLDAFVAKLTHGGLAMSYLTYLGGHQLNYGTSVAVDGSGSAFVTGYTGSPDFPTTPGAFQANFGECPSFLCIHAFFTKINSTGDVTYSTYLAGNTPGPPFSTIALDFGQGVAVDGLGNAYITGATNTTDFPSTPGAFEPKLKGGFDAFIVKFGADNPFDICLQDQTNPGNFVQINSTTGDFIFYCGGSVVASGRGTLHVRGSMGSMELNKGARRVSAQWDTTAQGGKGSGTAMVQTGTANPTCQITDKDMSKHTCIPGPSSAPGRTRPGQRQTVH
jgi:photosystem II stability/assembly factor-like uncharacterized protein